MEDIIEMELFSSVDHFQITQICEILKQNEIPYILKEAGSGAYLNISMGDSMQEKKIYVSSEDFDKASELIKNFISKSDNIEKKAVSTDKEEDNSGKKYTLVKRVMGLLVLGFAITAIGIVIISSFINK